MTESILMLVLMLAIFYFMLIRPENKRKKANEEMRSNLKKGDTVTTIGGIVGTIVKVNASTIIIETSEDRVRMELTKWAVSSTGVQASEQAEAKKADKKKELPDEPVEFSEPTSTGTTISVEDIVVSSDEAEEKK
ncbi:preprotein translocase subunit YajC [Dysosmobacter sp.]|uniref:preprotein translocase subunit YajC n=1 Tax=Dysosmobacter sp. TaxID=2591382 RepID=UPI002A8BD416|nr:preprotein translocase subunit YajC [Dysosmobacter sp.]MDY3281934.1 preprotein translocase subunit YajC [Dysosmobacter sp.]